jgi:hypothetical protein
MGTSTFGTRVAIGFLACAAWVAADLLAGAGVAAQTVPTCTNAPQPQSGPNSGNGVNNQGAGFFCMADLGSGPQLVVGSFYRNDTRAGYLLILDANGKFLHRTCWGVTETIDNCPHIVR